MAMRAQTQSGDSQNIFDRRSHKNRISRDHENSHPEYVQVLPDFEEGAFEQSCAAGAVTLDLDAEVVALRPVIAAAFASWRSVIANHLPLRSRARRESLAGLVLSTIEGAYIRGRAEHSKKPFLEAGEWLARLAQSESGKS